MTADRSNHPHILGTRSATPNTPRDPDSIDRMKEILNSAIENVEHQTVILRDALDRALGPNTQKDITGIAPIAPPGMSHGLAWLLGDLVRAHTNLADQVARIREQQV